MAFNDKPDVEFEGVILGSSAKAYKFQAEEWDQSEWVPKTQCTVVPDATSDRAGKCTLLIQAWLVEKNGWVK